MNTYCVEYSYTFKPGELFQVFIDGENMLIAAKNFNKFLHDTGLTINDVKVINMYPNNTRPKYMN